MSSLPFVVADYHPRCKAVHAEVIAAGFDPRLLFVVLINTAQFEFLLKEVLVRLSVCLVCVCECVCVCVVCVCLNVCVCVCV